MAKIMIADDAEETRNVLRAIIETTNHEVIAEAIDGDEAIDKATARNPDVLLLDLVLPKKNGLEVLNQIKKVAPNIEVVMISAIEDIKMVEDCIAAGAANYISKPFTVENVLSAISFQDAD